jgi:hypothetical protein
MGNSRDKAAYQRVITALKRQRKGVTVADVVAKTALPLEQVRELVPQAVDEYAARLEVTESGEIRYSFPRGFTSRYRGFRVGVERVWAKFSGGLKVFGTWAFKVWIMVMLVGYFVLFMLIALGALLLSMAASSSNSNNRSSSNRGGGLGGMYMASSIMNLIIRIWFYSELTKSMDRRYYGSRRPERPKGRPLYKAIFSFVLGDGDPNPDWAAREKQAVIAYIQAHRGVISLPEFMAITGWGPGKAEREIIACCAEFGGLPEATEEGTVVYRFDPLLLGADKKDRSFPGFSAPIKALFGFSSNTGKMNTWFSLINGVNLAFGSYFLYFALNFDSLLGDIFLRGIPAEVLPAGSYVFAYVYHVIDQFMGIDPLPLITAGLGIVPLAFSALFWLIPALRSRGIHKKNEEIKLENLRKLGFARVWETPLTVTSDTLDAAAPECRPKNMAAAQDRLIKEIGSYAIPDVAIDDRGKTVYAFRELEREKEALEHYRAAVNSAASDLGETVFDSDA